MHLPLITHLLLSLFTLGGEIHKASILNMDICDTMILCSHCRRGGMLVYNMSFILPFILPCGLRFFDIKSL
jgi:hypothetical protein